MKLKKTAKEYTLIALGALLVALGVNGFFVPIKISTGGVSGIGTVLYYVAGIDLSVTTVAVNLFLFVFGVRMLKKESILKTAAGIVFLSLFLEITESIDFGCEDLLIASVFGGGLMGAGVGLAVLCKASTGGSDFASLMLNKAFPHISVSTFILIIDSMVILVSGVIFGDFTVMLYSVISLYVCSKTADFILVKGDYAKSVLVVSENSTAIAKAVMTEMHRGVTGIYSKGYYSGKDGTMLICAVRPREFPTLMAIIKEHDNNAFTVITDAREVRGEGFKEN